MLSQDDYKLYTDSTNSFPEENWTKFVSMCAVRLARLLCLEKLPTDGDGSLPADLTMLLANFIFLVLDQRGGTASKIASKKIRNFTVNFSVDEASAAFSTLRGKYGDIIADYSACEETMSAESSTRFCCGRF